ncbi:uncharacterized protein LOC118202027 [Stegodyphus dumicola]|uniref:uncharacterized protein LOC118202027 n=1 Tax=Stegodyphus dumicola TaxID=202533 RepID=UPI0015B30051|nr:uncharacterized protein LOC118202027 [Stegodyphus dumicola]
MKKICSDSETCGSMTDRNKHQVTPLKTRRKTSRRDQGIDVHTISCSTPVSERSPQICNKNLGSPSCSIPCSQDNYPDVIWDYTSPKLPKGSKRREIKITVKEFLENLNQEQVSQCNTQSAHYIKLLEKWMTKKKVDTTVKKTHPMTKRDAKKKRHVMEDLKQFLETIQTKSQELGTDKVATDIRESVVAEDVQENLFENESKSNVSFKKSLLEVDNKEFDSADELWGDLDNSFLVTATQMESCNSLATDTCKQNLEITSTIPETEPSKVDKIVIEEPNIIYKTKSSLNEINYIDLQAKFLASQIITEWDSGSDDDWDNGYLEADVALSLIPDEVLSGTLPGQKGEGTENEILNATNKSDQNEFSERNCKAIALKELESFFEEDTEKVSENNLNSISSALVSEAEEACSGEIFSNFDVSFGDESILCKPEVLSWIDEVENTVSQNPKCTPEEIKKKKDEALKRRKKKFN